MCTSVLMPWEDAATASDKLGRGQALQKCFVGMQALILLKPTLNPRAGLQALLCSIPGQRGGALSNGTTCFLRHCDKKASIGAGPGSTRDKHFPFAILKQWQGDTQVSQTLLPRLAEDKELPFSPL